MEYDLHVCHQGVIVQVFLKNHSYCHIIRLDMVLESPISIKENETSSYGKHSFPCNPFQRTGRAGWMFMGTMWKSLLRGVLLFERANLFTENQE